MAANMAAGQDDDTAAANAVITATAAKNAILNT